MHNSAWQRKVAALAALLIIFVAVVAKIPTSHCHCHEEKSSSSSKEPCPFAQLRVLASTLLETSAVPVLTIFAEILERAPVEATPLWLVAKDSGAEARAPPFRA